MVGHWRNFMKQYESRHLLGMMFSFGELHRTGDEPPLRKNLSTVPDFFA
jgi:hypothetical protein